MPTLDVSELNIVIGVLGFFMVAYGVFSVKIKGHFYLGEALPAVIFGIVVGQIGTRFIDPARWGVAAKDQQSEITLGMTRVVIGIQLVIAGFQLPAKYMYKKIVPLFICLIPLMTIMWLFTTGCIMLMVPKLSLLSAMVIGSTVTSTDPVLSQALAKGPFADKFVPRPLREIISAEAAANDGFGFPFLMLATYLIRHADNPVLIAAQKALAETSDLSLVHRAIELVKRAGDVGRLGGGVGLALKYWLLETWLYFVLLSILYGAVIGYGMMWAAKFALRRKWIDTESYLLMPAGLGLFIIGTCGCVGIDDLLACTVAGHALNWDGQYLAETHALHDEVNSSIDVILNFGGFMYIGAVIPFADFHKPDTTGITIPILMALGVLVLFFRRIPGLFMLYRAMPSCVTNWKEALFMGYFGPIGIGAVFYVEHAKHLFPKKDQVDPADTEQGDLLAAMVPVVYWLVLFSIVVHGLSIPALNAFYKFRGIQPIEEAEPVEIAILSQNTALPKNARVTHRRSMVIHNRFSGAVSINGDAQDNGGPPLGRWNDDGKSIRFDDARSTRFDDGRSTRFDDGRSIRFDDGRSLRFAEPITPVVSRSQVRTRDGSRDNRRDSTSSTSKETEKQRSSMDSIDLEKARNMI